MVSPSARPSPARQSVDDERHNKECEPDFHQGAEIQIARRFGELVGDDAGHGVAGCEQRLRDRGTVPDHHCNGHGFAQRAPQSEDDAADDADSRIAQNPHADHLPARGA